MMREILAVLPTAEKVVTQAASPWSRRVVARTGAWRSQMGFVKPWLVIGRTILNFKIKQVFSELVIDLHPKYPIKGHADLVLKLDVDGEEQIMLLDIKTINT